VKKPRIGFISLSVFVLGWLLALGIQGKEPIVIAIASDGETLDSQVGDKAARCRWLLFFDEEGKLTETLENPYRDERGGAGTSCAELLADNKVTIFVAGFVGNKMASALERSKITFVSFTGTVKDAIAHVLEDITKSKIFSV
jgi:predicted Fe-Mo cluster-binding NifX family protein